MVRRSLVWIAVTVMMLLAASAGTAAGEALPARGAVSVSGPNATGHELSPAVAYNAAADEYFVVWRDGRNYATGFGDIYGRRVSSDGTNLGGVVRVGGSFPASDDGTPAIAWNAAENEYLVVWQSTNAITNRDRLYGRRLQADGTPLDRPFRIGTFVATGPPSTILGLQPSVVWNAAADQYLVVWRGDRRRDDNPRDIMMQRVGAGGASIGTAARVNGVSRNQEPPAVAWDSQTNQYLVVWAYAYNGWESGLCWRGVQPTGDFAGPEVCEVHGYSGTNWPEVAYSAAAGRYLVAYEDWVFDEWLGIFAFDDIVGQVIDADGASAMGYELTERECCASAPGLAWNSHDDRYLVVWEDDRNQATRGKDIFGRRVGSDGVPLDKPFRVSGGLATGDEGSAAVAYNSAANEFLVVWEDYRDQPTHGVDVYCRVVPG